MTDDHPTPPRPSAVKCASVKQAINSFGPPVIETRHPVTRDWLQFSNDGVYVREWRRHGTDGWWLQWRRDGYPYEDAEVLAQQPCRVVSRGEADLDPESRGDL